VQLGLVGLGKMGANMRDRLRAAGVEVLGFARSAGARDVDSLAELVDRLSAPRTVWIMVPAGDPTRDTVTQLAGLLAAGDLVVDGGNSRYTEDQVHAELLAGSGIGYLDCGVSGGVWGKDNGYGLMVGGAAESVERLMPVFDALRPEGPRDEGFVHAGADVVTDVPAVLKAWRRGTVVRSWLLDLLVAALDNDAELAHLRGWVEDSGEGRWTVEEAINHSVPAPVISAALFARFASRQDDSPAMRAVAALRQQFGGHAVQQASHDSAG
jgi:6-phosphogluconate dehydrogenase